MTHQAFSLEGLQPCFTPTRPFSERFGYLGTCVLPAGVLDDTTLLDPDTGVALPSLRQCCSQDGLCYAHVLYACSDGHYMADVAATPDLAETERVLFTEAQLIFALAWDKRLFWRTPLEIRRLMRAHAEELAPLVSHAEPAPPAALFPAPVEPLTVVTTVEVTPEELRQALEGEEASHCSDTLTHRYATRPSVFAVQQGLLCALSRALEELLDSATDPYTSQVLQTLSALVARVRPWHHQTHQRVVNAACAWNAASNNLAWALTLGVPQALLGSV